MDYTDLDDFQLIDMLKKGDEKAMTEIVHRYQNYVFRLVYKFLNNYDASKDCAQEVFIALFKGIGSFKKKSSFKTWLYRISVNCAISSYKKALKSRKTVSLQSVYGERYDEEESEYEIPDGSLVPFKEADENERSKILFQKISEIKEIYRVPLVLRDIEGLSYEEISEILNVDLGTVKSRISRGRESLRNKLLKTEAFQNESAL